MAIQTMQEASKIAGVSDASTVCMRGKLTPPVIQHHPFPPLPATRSGALQREVLEGVSELSLDTSSFMMFGLIFRPWAPFCDAPFPTG